MIKKPFILITITIINFMPIAIFASPRSSSFNTRSSNSSIRSRSERTGVQTGWGMQNKHPSMVDLSEWGGEKPSCDIAPDCPVCIP